MELSRNWEDKLRRNLSSIKETFVSENTWNYYYSSLTEFDPHFCCDYRNWPSSNKPRQDNQRPECNANNGICIILEDIIFKLVVPSTNHLYACNKLRITFECMGDILKAWSRPETPLQQNYYSKFTVTTAFNLIVQMSWHTEHIVPAAQTPEQNWCEPQNGFHATQLPYTTHTQQITSSLESLETAPQSELTRLPPEWQFRSCFETTSPARCTKVRTIILIATQNAMQWLTASAP